MHVIVETLIGNKCLMRNIFRLFISMKYTRNKGPGSLGFDRVAGILISSTVKHHRDRVLMVFVGFLTPKESSVLQLLFGLILIIICVLR